MTDSGLQIFLQAFIKTKVTNKMYFYSRKKMRRGERAKPVKKAAPSFSLATTTPLVRNIFDSIFQGQILDDDAVAKGRRKRCGTCEVGDKKNSHFYLV